MCGKATRTGGGDLSLFEVVKIHQWSCVVAETNWSGW